MNGLFGFGCLTSNKVIVATPRSDKLDAPDHALDVIIPGADQVLVVYDVLVLACLDWFPFTLTYPLRIANKKSRTLVTMHRELFEIGCYDGHCRIGGVRPQGFLLNDVIVPSTVYADNSGKFIGRYYLKPMVTTDGNPSSVTVLQTPMGTFQARQRPTPDAEVCIQDQYGRIILRYCPTTRRTHFSSHVGYVHCAEDLPLNMLALVLTSEHLGLVEQDR